MSDDKLKVQKYLRPDNCELMSKYVKDMRKHKKKSRYLEVVHVTDLIETGLIEIRKKDTKESIIKQRRYVLHLIMFSFCTITV